MAKLASDFDTGRCHQLAALPWRREKDGTISVLLITSRTNGKWMLPKGWPMDGRTDPEAAAQEALEEAGVSGTATTVPLGSYAYIKLFDDGSTKPSQAIVYGLQVTEQHRDWREKGQRKRKWFSARKAATLAFEPDLGRFLAKVAKGQILLPGLASKAA